MEKLSAQIITAIVTEAKQEIEAKEKAKGHNTIFKLYENIIEEFVKLFDFISEQDQRFACDLLVAPAAEKEHQNYKHGLLEHNAKLALWLSTKVQSNLTPLTIESAARIAFCHDLCKVVTYTIKTVFGKERIFVDNETKKTHAKLSLEICDHFGIVLTAEERACIALHMAGGWYKKEDRDLVPDSDLLAYYQSIDETKWGDMLACD